MKNKCYILTESLYCKNENINYEEDLVGIYYNMEDAIKDMLYECNEFKEELRLDNYYGVENPTEDFSRSRNFARLIYGDYNSRKVWEIEEHDIKGISKEAKELCQDLLSIDPNKAFCLIEKIAYA